MFKNSEPGYHLGRPQKGNSVGTTGLLRAADDILANAAALR